MATLTELVDKQQYDEHMRVVATVLENDATHATVCQHLADGLTDPANVEQMVQEIAKVNQRIKDIEAAFSSIDLELAAFDDLNLKDKEQALRLRPQWATLFNVRSPSPRGRDRRGALLTLSFTEIQPNLDSKPQQCSGRSWVHTKFVVLSSPHFMAAGVLTTMNRLRRGHAR